MRYVVFICVMIMGFGCSQSPQEHRLLHQDNGDPHSHVHAKVNLESETFDEILYRTKSKTLRAHFSMNTRFIPHEYNGTNGRFYAVSCVERSTPNQLPASFALVYYPQEKDLDDYYQIVKKRIKGLRFSQVVDDTMGIILETKARILDIEYDQFFPPYRSPQRNVAVKERLVLFMIEEKLYEIRFSARTDAFKKMLPFYDRFISTLRIGDEH